MRDWITNQDSEVIFLEGLDDAMIGIADISGRPPVVAYDQDRVIDILCEHGASKIEAMEHIAGAYLGERTPVYIYSSPVSEVCRLRRLLLEEHEKRRVAEHDRWQAVQDLQNFECIVVEGIGWRYINGTV